MFAGTAAGVMLPPMVVYKAGNLYTSWLEGGPPGTKYSCSESGWFDGCQFEKFYFELLLPTLRRKQGKKLLIGDNLSSHISPAVIESCKANNIAFVCLPPNSTDKLQPLDVGIFAPLKAAWKSTLSTYKQKNPKQASIDKCDFPGLLKKTLLKADIARHLPAAFEKCGLYPVSKERAMERIPHRQMEVENETARRILDSTLGERLEALRGVDKKEAKKKRGKKIKVPAGRSYTEDPEEEEDVDALLEEVVPVKARRSRPLLESDTSDDDRELPDEDDDEDKDRDVGEDGDVGMEEQEEEQYRVGSFVVAVYEKSWYLAQVEGEEEEEETEGFTLLKYMERAGPNQFVWGKRTDRLKTLNSDIIMLVEGGPIPISSRFVGLPKEVVKKVEERMRVLWSIIPDFPFFISKLAKLSLKMIKCSNINIPFSLKKIGTLYNLERQPHFKFQKFQKVLSQK